MMTENDKLQKSFKREPNPSFNRITIAFSVVILLIFLYGDKAGLFANRNIHHVSTNLYITENATIINEGAQYREDLGCDFYKFQSQAVDLQLIYYAKFHEEMKAGLAKSTLELFELQMDLFELDAKLLKENGKANFFIINPSTIEDFKYLHRQSLERQIIELDKTIEWKDKMLSDRKLIEDHVQNYRKFLKIHNLIQLNIQDCTDPFNAWSLIKSQVNH